MNFPKNKLFQQNLFSFLFLISILLSILSAKFSEIFQMISVYTKSSSRSSAFDVTQQMIPLSFRGLKSLSFVFEFSILVDSTEILIDSFDFFKFNSANVISIIPNFSEINSDYQFSTSDEIYSLFELNSKKIENRVQKTLFFTVNVDQTNSQTSLVHISFSKNELENLPPNFSETVISTGTIQPDAATYFTISLPHGLNHSSSLRNLLCLNRSLLDQEKANLFGGIANLQQAFYLYMEPVNSKVLHNRSWFNYEPAINGSLGSSFDGMYSTFSEQTGHTEWLLGSNRNEYLVIQTSLFNPRLSQSVSIMVNFETFLFSDKQFYLGKLNDRRIPFLSFYDNLDDKFLDLWLYTLYDELDPDFITMHLHFKDENLGYFFHFEFEKEAIDKETFQLSPVNLILSFIYPNEQDLYIQVELDRQGSKTTELKKINKPLPESGIKYIILGDKRSELYSSTSVALVNVFDIQIFEGSAFLLDPDDLDVLISVNKFAPHIARCLSNKYPNRISQNEQLDKIYHSELASIQTCSEFEFNANCAVADCEICGVSDCLICKLPFLLENGRCISMELDRDNLVYDVFSRNKSFTVKSAISRVDVVPGSNVPLSKTDSYIYGRILFDVSTYDYTFYPIAFKINGDYHYFFNPNPLSPVHKAKFNFSSDLSEVYFMFKSGDPVDISINRYALSVEYLSAGEFCSNKQPTLSTSLKVIYCFQLIADFTHLDYYVSEFEASTEMVFNISNYDFALSLFDKYLQILTNCRNNCECGISMTGLECNSCAADFYLILYSEYSTSCEPCESDYLINCTSDSNSIDTISPETIGGHGGTGVSTEICSADCDDCDGQTCIACSKYPHNHKYQINQETAIFQPTNTYFCQSCPNDCFACASETECHCAFRSGYVFVDFIKNFNLCLYRICSENCTQCNNKKICVECRRPYQLSNNECVLSSQFIKNCAESSNNHCIKCNPQYLLESACIKCPSNCIECIRHSQTRSLVCIECLPGFQLSPQLKCYRLQARQLFQQVPKPDLTCPEGHYYSPTTKKCSPCSENCLACDAKECQKCQSPLFPVKSECALCSISNCMSCPVAHSCLECSSGHYFDSISQKCLECPLHCIKCTSSSRCLLCESSHSLWTRDQGVICAPNCRAGFSYFDPEAVDCLSCSECKFCGLESPCSSCDICEQSCDTFLVSERTNQHSLISRNVDFSKAVVEHLMPSEGKSIKEFKFQDKIVFALKTDKDFVFSIRIRADSLKTFNCSIKKDILLELPGVSELSIFDIKGIKILHSIGSNIKKMTLGFSLITSMFSCNNLVQSLVYLSSVSSLYSYTFILDKGDKFGLSGVITTLNKMSILSETIFFPLSKLQVFWAFQKFNEFNINYVSLNSYQVIVIVLFFTIYFLSYECTSGSDDAELSKEWFPYFLKNRMDKQFMKSFFKKLRKKTSADTCNQIIRFLRKTKRKIQSNKLQKMLRKLNRTLRKRRYKFIFLIFCLFYQELAHLSAKSIRYYYLFPEEKMLLAYCWIFHSISGGILLLVISRADALSKQLHFFVTYKEEDQLEEYFDYARFLFLNLFSFIFVYFLVLLSGRVSVELCVAFFFLLSVVLGLVEKRYLYFDPSYLKIRFLIKITVIMSLVINSSGVISSVYSDLIFVLLQLFGFFLSIYSAVVKLNEKWKKQIKSTISQY